MKLSQVFFLLFALLLILSPEVLSAQCSMCRAVLESEEGWISLTSLGMDITAEPVQAELESVNF